MTQSPSPSTSSPTATRAASSSRPRSFPTPATAPSSAKRSPSREANRTPDFTSPCKAPSGGWKPVDPAKATNDALEATNALVSADPDFAGLWIDETPPPELATPMNNPARLVLNVRFTKDLSRHEAEIRKVWGGALCVSKAERTDAELRRVQDELSSEPGMAFASTDIVSGTVEIGVFLARQNRQNELDVKYGTGVVTLIGALQPID